MLVPRSPFYSEHLPLGYRVRVLTSYSHILTFAAGGRLSSESAWSFRRAYRFLSKCIFKPLLVL